MKKISAFVLVLVFTRSLVAADAPPTDVVVIDHSKVDTAFKGTPQALMANTSYKIMAARRVTAPGQVEIHEHDTDIFYITEGTATMVTGGKTEGGKPSGEGEIRGDTITGGTKRTLQKGDIVVIPAGVPHWFTEVSNPFLYFVVKVTK